MHVITERPCRFLNVLGSYSKDPVQVSARRPAILIEDFVVFLSLSTQGGSSRRILNQASTTSFEVLSSSLFINDPIVRHYIV